MKNLLFILFTSWILAVYPQAKINWQAWGNKPFTAAKKQHKPVFLDVGTEWCTACNFMEDETYSDTAVIRILNQNFVCIKADAEAQPDVGARYLQWGWPALIFFDAEGNQMNALQGNRRPALFIPILKNYLEKFYKGELKPDNEDFYSPEPPDNSAVGQLYAKADKQLNSYYDSLYGGWGFDLKIPLYQPVEYCFWLNKTSGKKGELKKATKSLTQYAKISDRIWGGVYFGCSSTRDWSNAQPEKRAEYQAGVLHNYAEAYMATGDNKWLAEAQLLKSYMLNMLLSEDDSLFCNSQEEYLTAAGNPPGMPPEKYFKLPAEKRLKYGIPPIDKTLYTDINFRAVKGFVKLYEATQNPEDLQLAVTIAKRIMRKAYLPQGWFKTVIENRNAQQRIRELPDDSSQENVMYLKTQAHAAIALLQLYQYTNDTSWLQICKRLNESVCKQLYDSVNGGFFSTDQMPVTLGGKITKTKVLTENALYARFLIEFGNITDNEKFEKLAEGALRSVGTDKILQNEERLIADYTLAADQLIKGHLLFTIVTEDPNSEEAKGLLTLAKSYYHPAKLIKVEKPGHYPQTGTASLFVCSKIVCSPPISFSLNSKRDVDAFIKRLK
jgi:uncharacterized protein YyaL (SSP411 family)